MDDNALYQEESLQVQKDLLKHIKGSAIVPMPEIPKRTKTEVINTVEARIIDKVVIDDEPFARLSASIEDYLRITVRELVKALADNKVEPLESIKVDNIEKAKADSVVVSNLGELESSIKELAKSIVENKPQINVSKQDVRFPNLPRDYVSVRLTDGKQFYDAKGGSGAGILPSPVNTDPLVGYQPADIDDSASTKYYGFSNKQGHWYIMRESSNTFRYARGGEKASGGGLYSDAWTDRANLSYSYFHEVF